MKRQLANDLSNNQRSTAPCALERTSLLCNRGTANVLLCMVMVALLPKAIAAQSQSHSERHQTRNRIAIGHRISAENGQDRRQRSNQVEVDVEQHESTVRQDDNESTEVITVIRQILGNENEVEGSVIQDLTPPPLRPTRIENGILSINVEPGNQWLFSVRAESADGGHHSNQLYHIREHLQDFAHPGLEHRIEAIVVGAQNDHGLHEEPLRGRVLFMQPSLPPSEYWVGIQCVATPESIQRQLGVEGGLLVESVAPDSPALRSGIHVHDVLIELAGEPVMQVEQLVSAIDEHRQQPIAATVMRRGTINEVTIVPEPRLAAEQRERIFTFGTVIEADDNRRAFHQAISEWTEHRSNSDSTDRLRMILVRPGMIVNSEEFHLERQIRIDDRRRLQVRSRAGSAYRVVLSEDEETMELTLDRLEGLPESIRQLATSATSRFLYLDAPMQVNGVPVSLFPSMPFEWNPAQDIFQGGARVDLPVVHFHGGEAPVITDENSFRVLEWRSNPHTEEFDERLREQIGAITNDHEHIQRLIVELEEHEREIRRLRAEIQLRIEENR